MKRAAVALSALLGGLCLFTLCPGYSHAEDQMKVVTPGQLTWQPIKTLPPGAQVSIIEGPLNQNKPFIFRIKMAPGWKAPPHTHPVLTHVTVISGMFNLGVGDKFDASKLHAYPPGSVLILQPGQAHFAQMKEETVIQVHGIGPWGTFWVDPNDDPAKKIN